MWCGRLAEGYEGGFEGIKVTFNVVVGGRLSASQAADDVVGFSHCTTACRELVRGNRVTGSEVRVERLGRRL